MMTKPGELSPEESWVSSLLDTFCKVIRAYIPGSSVLELRLLIE